MRTFIAIDLESGLKKAVLDFVERLRPMGRDVRWVNSQGMHLTLKFLGETSEQDVPKVGKALESIGRSHQPFSLVFKGTGAFPPGKKPPRVLWIGVLGNPALMGLQKDVEDATERLGFPREGREFHPHLTLGRVKVPFRLEPLLEEMGTFKESSFGEMEAAKLTFFQSVLKPGGAEYRILSEFRLG